MIFQKDAKLFTNDAVLRQTGLSIYILRTDLKTQVTSL